MNNPTCTGVSINNNGSPGAGGTAGSTSGTGNATSHNGSPGTGGTAGSSGGTGNATSNNGGKGNAAQTENPLKGLPEPKVGKPFKAAAAGIGCFSAEMLVKTPNGTKRMDELKVGDEVTSNTLYAQQRSVMHSCKYFRCLLLLLKTLHHISLWNGFIIETRNWISYSLL